MSTQSEQRSEPVAPWRWALGALSAVLIVFGSVTGFLLFSGGGGAPGLFGGSAFAAFGVIGALIAKDGEV